MSELLFKQLYKSSLRFLGLRLRSIHELRVRLSSWLRSQEGLDAIEKERLADRVIDQLIKERFLDDERFVREWIASRLRSKPRGEVLIRLELQQKGIPKVLVDDAFQSLRSNSPDSSDALYVSALRLGEKYLKKYSSLPLREGKYKLSAALMRKGFDGSLVKRVVDELFVRG